MPDGQFKPAIHDEYLGCPRPRCTARNAPEDSDDYSPRCHDCGAYLEGVPVSPGDTLTVEIVDIHESGAGVGKTDTGFIILVDGVLPEARARVNITRVKDTFAWADPLETLPADSQSESDTNTESSESATPTSESDTDTESSEDEERAEEDESEPLGSRDNFWG